ncbi:MAG: hypothetical protein QF442_01245 [Candidatus Peribacteraceae bacterium]|nr:hypothetical protein [Candidatus Peribacteraceae bacterium]
MSVVALKQSDILSKQLLGQGDDPELSCMCKPACGDGYECIANVCELLPCFSDDDCASGQTCHSDGKCENIVDTSFCEPACPRSCVGFSG